ncbi:RNA polymerase sigma factor [Allokutzneria sp. NRRL B-24872]|uniref:RNA polymerase sigma factor n=1 Tax=Allokutzneria sp. NRRL B-24872 TaxID=1137961 RepID=UPI000A380841|nr:RNA polymerase sigma factor [Allokutzneria sp. NRRL B-24872]
MTDFTRIGHDPAAFEAFYREHVQAVQRFVVRRVDDPHLAADLTADVFLAVIDTAHTFRADRGDPTRWLFGVARNVVAGELRRRARGLRAASRIAGRALLDEDDIAALERRIDAASRARELYRAMDRLSDGERAVLELVALDGLTVQDAAKALGVRAGTARVRLHRARRLMREHLVSSNAEVLP